MYIWVVDMSASVYVVYFSVDAATAFVRQSSLSLSISLTFFTPVQFANCLFGLFFRIVFLQSLP